jgi:hypothetical protein
VSVAKRGCRAVQASAKAMEGVWDPEAGAEEPSGVRALNVRKVVLGTGESLLGPAAAGGGKRGSPITGDSGKWRVVERQSERVVLVVIGGTTQPVGSEGPVLHRCTTEDEWDG